MRRSRMREMLGFVACVGLAAACGGGSESTTASTGGQGGAGSSTGTAGGGAGTGGASSSSSGSGGGGLSDPGPIGPSCAGGLTCQGVSCCANILVPGGKFPMGRGDGSDAFAEGNEDEQPEHEVTVKSFRLDAFEVTVGRFRAFTDAYDGTPPQAGSGTHPGMGNFMFTGWDPTWNNELPATRDDLVAALSCNFDPNFPEIWTATPGPNEALPVNCVTWYEAFAFCIWDGGYLPTEADWEYAAAGGEENRLYPWGSQPPTDDLAALTNILPVGSTPLGNGRWGHRDLAGNVLEWVFDSYDPDWYLYPFTGCDPSCPNYGDDLKRVLRGGHAWPDPDSHAAAMMRVAVRGVDWKTKRFKAGGFRCARPAYPG